MQERPIIYIVDSDSSVRRAMKRLLQASHMQARTFATPEEFLASTFQEQNACLIVDVNGRGDSGLELQKSLAARGTELPIIFMTTLDVGEVRDRLKEAGAAGYFRKPVDDQALLDAIRWALSNQRTTPPQ